MSRSRDLGSAAGSLAAPSSSYNGYAHVVDTTQASGWNYTSPYYAGKNFLINGNFDYWQRGFTSSSGFGPDRWFSFGVGSMTRTAFSAIPEVPNATYFMRYVNTSTGYQMVQQTIENGGLDLSGKTISVSFWARSNTNNTFSMACFSLLGNDQQPTSPTDTYGFTVTPTWTKYSYTTNVPITNGTNTHRYFRIGQSTAGIGYGFDLAQVQIEIGGVATTFTRAGGNLGNELILCQRYYEKSWNIDVAPGTNTINGLITQSGTAASRTTGEIRTDVLFQVQKRIAPTVILYDHIGTINKITRGDYGVSFNSGQTGSVYSVGTRSFNTYSNSGSVYGSTHVLHFTADCEI
jgi:hypothetical protein